MSKMQDKFADPLIIYSVTKDKEDFHRRINQIVLESSDEEKEEFYKELKDYLKAVKYFSKPRAKVTEKKANALMSGPIAAMFTGQLIRNIEENENEKSRK